MRAKELAVGDGVAGIPKLDAMVSTLKRLPSAAGEGGRALKRIALDKLGSSISRIGVVAGLEVRDDVGERGIRDMELGGDVSGLMKKVRFVRMVVLERQIEHK